jgi:2-dehydro-3-deoxyglucarate aldolase/4-hydroxy-2-oxoheptanedioate aldolase
VVLDTQHGVWNPQDLHAAIGIVARYATPIVRVPENTAAAIGAVLDKGALGVIVPLVEDAEQAARAVAAAKYPPEGGRSAGGIRPSQDFPAYARAANDAILVAVMIETAKGLDNAAAIAATPGVDLIFIGPADLGLSIGEFPEFGDRHAAAVKTIQQVCSDAGIGVGMFARTVEESLSYRDRGFHLVTLGSDISIITAGARQAVDAFGA